MRKKYIIHLESHVSSGLIQTSDILILEGILGKCLNFRIFNIFEGGGDITVQPCWSSPVTACCRKI